MRTKRAVPAFLLFAFTSLLVSRPGRADVFWKLTDEGPSAPDVTAILGDDSRTLAFAASGVFEYRFGTWARVELSAPNGEAEVPGTPFFTGGTFFALKEPTDFSGLEWTLYRLSANAWQKLATFATSLGQVAWDSRFLYGVSGRFNDCVDIIKATCEAATARLFTISLTDGSRHDGPMMPFCFGRLMVAGGTAYYVGVPPRCYGPPVVRKARALAMPPTPIYRLDGNAWTALPPVTDYVEYSDFFGTPAGLWRVVHGSAGLAGISLLTGSSWLTPISLPPGPAVAPMSWGSEILYVTNETSGNLYRLRNDAFVPFDPAPPISLPTGRLVGIYPAGSRLFATGDGWDPQVLSAGAWAETLGITPTPGGDLYLASSNSAFASRGGTFWKHGETGWTRLPRPPIGTTPFRGVVWRERPVLVDATGYPMRLVAYSDSTGTWEDLGFPGGGNQPFLLVSGDMLCAAEDLYAACLRDGTWTVARVPPPPPSRFFPSRLRELDGEVTLIAVGNAYHVRGTSLEPLFTDIPSFYRIDDVASVDGRTYLRVLDMRPSANVLHSTLLAAEPGYPALLTDREEVFVSENSTLSVTNGRLFVSSKVTLAVAPACSFRGSQLHQARGGAPIRYLDPAGVFASTGSNDLNQRGSLLLPVTRPVRKTLPAVVDTIGKGGVHFRSEVTVANLSPTRSAVAHLVPGTAADLAVDVALPPLAQSRILDPFPDFVGPVPVIFDGLDDERDAWALSRVFSASAGGTAGTSLEGVDPGSNLGNGALLPLALSPSSRTHVAAANAADGPGLPVRPYVAPGIFGLIPPGGLEQQDFSLYWPFLVDLSSGWEDDALVYAVRNDDATNDGTVVPMEPPDTVLSQRTRFLPAVISLMSSAVRYRTELRLVRRARGIDYLPLSFHVLFRSASVSGEFDITVGVGTLDVPDAAAWLAANGVAVDPMASVDGTLTFTSDRPEGALDLVVTAAVFARPTGLGGEYGVSVPLVSEGRWATTSAVVPGLLENGAFRSNVALANPEPPGGPPTTLSVTLHRASDGGVAGALPPVTLKPGERFQLNRIARLAGIAGTFDGWAAVSRTGGSGRFVAYGVLNDETTSDGTLLSMTRPE